MQVIFVPFVDRKKFADSVGITTDVLDGWIRRGYIKTIKIGKRSLVDLTSYIPNLD